MVLIKDKLTASQQKAKTAINCLTENEDIRQDLWILFLKGTPVPDLNKALSYLSVSYHPLNLAAAAQSLALSPFFLELINNFTELELFIIICLAAGHDVATICRYKGITEVRMRLVISSVIQNEAWADIWRLRYDSRVMKDMA